MFMKLLGVRIQKGDWEMKEHDKIVKNLKHQLESKGFRLWSFPKDEAMIAQIGYRTIKPKISHVEFKPDIIFSGSEKLVDRFFIEYVHTKERFVYDLRGMIALKQRIKKARGFHLIINDSIHVPLKGLKGGIDSQKLSTFLKSLNKYSKEAFLRYLDG